jgi:hypothetical protein
VVVPLVILWVVEGELHNLISYRLRWR